jgi:hypothetical protein
MCEMKYQASYIARRRKTHMNNATRLVAWVCIFSTPLAGCYTSSLIEQNGAEKERIYSGNIESVVTKDGKRYEFEKPPVVANDTIVGGAKCMWHTKVNQEETSIPDSDVALVGKSNSGNTEYVVTKAGVEYTYDDPPAYVNGAYVGKARFTGYMPVNKGQVSIPLSDVAEISLPEFSTWRTAGAITLGVAAVAGIVWAVTDALHKMWTGSFSLVKVTHF